jgi:hypothetical protein
MMVTIQQAVSLPVAFAEATLGKEQTASARLEEVETLTVDGKEAWHITLSFRSLDPPSPLASAFESLAALRTPARFYKSFTILKETGEVISMKIRELAGA